MGKSLTRGVNWSRCNDILRRAIQIVNRRSMNARED